MTESRILTPMVLRFASNIWLFYALALAVGVLAGLVGALGNDGWVTGGGSDNIVYYDPGTGTATVEDNINFGRLIFYPLLTVGVGTLAVLPVILVGLGVAELLTRVGASERTLRRIAIGGALLVALAVISNDRPGLFVLVATALVVYAALFRLPEGRKEVVERRSRDDHPGAMDAPGS